ncbi:hypothetical protein KP509_34G022600 [Ceratopteris richardii]|uniref:E2 ubiquitin-conjugating enzyme n=1 Tax=Ceratopteris richardii TaxID=49495 RepID=A0A8T2QJP6_CERRI|nr:hypothetical protein KP509_34G022600 [Ceratopteris richardii]
MEQTQESSINLQSDGTAKDAPQDLSKDVEKPRFAGLYREDVVQSVSKTGILGLVAKIAGDSDSDSSDSEDEQYKEADDDTLSQGCARICWANSEESTHKIDDIKVVDRSFMHGDVVAKVSVPMGQTGIVTSVDLKIDLQLPNGEIISGVDSKTISRVRSFVVGDYVIHDQWLGRIDEIYDNVTVMFGDGSKCRISCADPDRLVPVSLSPMDDSECPYYPGQRVKASFTGVFKSARWLKGCWKPNRNEGTVVNVEVDSVVVYWMAAASTGTASEAPGIPAERQNPKNLKRLMNFSHTTWQLGDRALLPQRYSKKSACVSLVSSELALHSDHEAEEMEGVEQVHDSDLVDGGQSAPTSGKESTIDSWVAYRRKLKRRLTKHKKRAIKKGDFYEPALLVVGTKTRVDVLWQDGTRERNVDTCTLFPVDHVGDHDFWPEQHVMERGSEQDEHDSEISKRSGIVRSVDSKQRTARVRWLSSNTHPQKWPSFEGEEVVSVYELVEHPDFDYCLGDVVIRLSPSVDPSNEASTACAPTAPEDRVASAEKGTEQQQGTASSSTGGIRDELGVSSKSMGETNMSDLSWVGIITAIQDGQIEVAWANGEVKVGSHAIYVVGRDDDDDGSSQATAAEMEEMDDAASWTTVDSNDTHDVEEEQELDQSDHQSPEDRAQEGYGADMSMGEASSKQNGPGETQSSSGMDGHEMRFGNAFSLSFSALLRALKFAASLLWAIRGPKRYVNQEQSPDYGRKIGSEVHDSTSDNNIQDDETAVQQAEGEAVSMDCGQECHSPTKSEMDDMSHVEDRRIFKQFDSVKNFTDHHFKDDVCQPSNQRRWSKKIQQEWAMLEKCLPETIFVRVFEDRMDLMRSVIVGASGTPYHDGLFFFDLYLPAEYPSSPPHVHYHSGGLRLNPNLYETGKVCLSLLNTWTGKGNEIWHSSTSSILQVLVSIQGLVLNANPYFNEAGYDKQMGTAEGEKNSLAYVENSFLLSCKSMLYLIRRPPMHFEDFVKDHFRRRGPFILRACHAYMQGSPVGSLADDGTVSHLSRKDLEQSTVGFRIMLAKIIPRLISAFKETGACCDAYEQKLSAISV